MPNIVNVHPYQRSLHSGAGNCWCGWPELWGDEPPPIHGGRPWRERHHEPKEPGFVRARRAIHEQENGCPTQPILWE